MKRFLEPVGSLSKPLFNARIMRNDRQLQLKATAVPQHSVVHAFPAKVQYNDRAQIHVTLEGKAPYWKPPIWNVSVETAGFLAT